MSNTVEGELARDSYLGYLEVFTEHCTVSRRRD